MLQKENFRLENIGRKTIEIYIIIRCLMVIFKEKFIKRSCSRKQFLFLTSISDIPESFLQKKFVPVSKMGWSCYIDIFVLIDYNKLQFRQ